MLLKMGLRNLRRHKRRTITSSFIIAIGIIFYISMMSMLDGMAKTSIDSTMQLSFAPVKVFTKEYYGEKDATPLDYGIENYQEIVSYAMSINKVTGVTPRTQFLSEIFIDKKSQPIMATVIDEKLDTMIYKYVEYIEDGGRFLKDDNDVLIGYYLAKDFNLKVGDYITLASLTKYDSRNADEFKIVGVINAPDMNITNGACYMSYKTADLFLDLEGLKTELNISLEKKSSVKAALVLMDEVKLKLKEKFPNYSVYSFRDLNEEIFTLTESKRGFGYIFLVIIMLIAGVGIFNTVLMSTYERMREIGVLKAHGMKNSDLTRLFVYEGFITGLIGGIIGCVVAGGVDYWLINTGIDYSKMAAEEIARANASMNLGVMKGVFVPTNYIIMFSFSVLVASFAAWLPARSASKKQVTEALKFN